MTTNSSALFSVSLLFFIFSAYATQQVHSPPTLEDLLRQETKNEPAEVEVSTSARNIKSVRNSPQSTYIVTDDEILAFNLKTLAEILNFMPGLYTSSDSTFEYLTARGVGRPGDYNSRILFLVDGTRVNDNLYDAGLIASDFYIDTELIDRVEYSPGAGSTLYGNNAFLGVVNVITKRSNKLRGAELSVSANNQTNQQYRVSYAYRNDDGQDAWLSISHSEQQNIPIADATSAPFLQPFSEDNTDSNNKIAGTYRYKQLQIQAAAVRRKRQEPSFVDGTQDEFALSQSVSENYFIALQHSTEINDNLAFFTNVSTNQVTFDNLLPFQLSPGNNQQYWFAVEGQWTNADVRFNYQGLRDHQLLFGVDGQRNNHQSYALSIQNIAPVLAYSTDSQRLGAYVQDEWRFTANQLLVTGFRFDRTSEIIREISPKISWIWQPTTKQSLKLSYGKAFRAPNEYELQTNRYYQEALPESEHVKTTELIWDEQVNQQFSYHAALYHSKLSSLISSKYGQSVLVAFFNDRPVQSYGLETGFDYAWDFGGHLNLSLSLQQAYYRSAEHLTNSPNQLAKAIYSHPLPWLGWQLNWHTLAAGQRQTIQQPLPGYIRHDLSVSWQADPDIDVVFGFKNITNQRYTEAPLPSSNELYQPSRRAELSIRWRFQQ